MYAEGQCYIYDNVQMLFMGRDWPQGYDVFRQRAKRVFIMNSTETDPVKVQKSLDLGNYVLKEIEALYKLKKYRTLKRRYYS